MMDNHPALLSLPGEDSFLAKFFLDLNDDPDAAVANLRSRDNIDYILLHTGRGINKWQELWKLSQSGTPTDKVIWSGTQQEGKGYVTDYQDTIIPVDYPAYLKRLQDLAQAIREAPSFMDVFWYYLDALSYLNGQRSEQAAYGRLLVGSGMRSEMAFVFERTDNTYCIAPLRPFDTYYYSFAKGRFKTTEVEKDVLKEAWEHWWHKSVDYLIMKQRYPERFCLINFNHAISDTEETSREVCRFLGIPFNESCLTPTTLGVMTKGNSSFPKGEQARGTFYKSGMKRKLDPEYWPADCAPLWDIMSRVTI
ncbi:MAG: sulfotransferase domain-containing protein [Magnetococcales bacterium]|nr:sulfotransferase domain-containing protein [Magnetococcales bacterium]